MNLDVNFRRVRQENFIEKEGKDFKSSIFEENGVTFQNSPIHIIFYEKQTVLDQEGLVPTLEELKLSSLGYCRLRQDFATQLGLEDTDQEVQLVEHRFNATSVSKEKYKLLLYILGQSCTSVSDNHEKYKRILTLFNSFHTNSEENFKLMLKQLEFPYSYNQRLSLAENRRLFKDFFLSLPMSDVQSWKDPIVAKLPVGLFMDISWEILYL